MQQRNRKAVITRTPLRISFVGGGTDIPEYSDRFGGAVISATINKYIYVIVANHFYKDEINIRYSQSEESVKDIDEIKHPITREALRMLNLDTGIQISILTEIPSRGTGLGSSSTLTVGLLNALHEWKGDKDVTPYQLSLEAVKLERETLKEAGGKQDQFMASFGGIQYIEFLRGGNVRIHPILLKSSAIKGLENHLLLFYTGGERSSHSIHIEQLKTIDENIHSYYKIRELATEQLKAFLRNDWKSLGKRLDADWKIKRTLASEITNSKIDGLYEKIKQEGAIGAKLIGAGGSGFMLVFLNPKNRQKVINVLEGYQIEPFKFTQKGSEILHSD